MGKGFHGCIAVIGPPAVGKSTLVAHLRRRLPVEVFRLREFAQGFRERPGIDLRLFDTTDTLGWFSDYTVAVMLRAACEEMPRHRWMLAEGFPGCSDQLRLLVAQTQRLRVPLHVVELSVPMSVLVGRSQQRRVCLGCEPDEWGDAHRPATPHPDDPERCSVCVGRTTRRSGDLPAVYAARLERFRSRVSGIRRGIAALHVSYSRIEATAAPVEIASRVVADISVRYPRASVPVPSFALL